VALDVGRLGLWSFLDALPAAESAAFARKVERWGYRTLWIPEAVGREPFAHAAYLSSKTDSLAIATGIANIWARDAMTMAAGGRTVSELSGGRFVLGIGVSHAPLVSGVRGHDYAKPYTYMQSYLSQMRLAVYAAPSPPEEPPVVLAALHPKMLRLAATAARGTHTYFVPPEHTAKARAAMGPEAWLCVAQAVILETDPAKARAAARTYMQTYVPTLTNYTRNLRALGWTDADFADGCSDRLVDAIVAWGSEAQIRERIAAHHRAGATHVCILPLRTDGMPIPDERAAEALAPR
jgi:probable F420-dependent oxidoreductase